MQFLAADLAECRTVLAAVPDYADPLKHDEQYQAYMQAIMGRWPELSASSRGPFGS